MELGHAEGEIQRGVDRGVSVTNALRQMAL